MTSSAVDGVIMLRVLRALAQRPGLTRAELVACVGASRPSVSTALRVLEGRGFLEQRIDSDDADGRPAIGRPPMRVFLAGSAASAIGVEITRTQIHAGVFDVSGRLLGEGRVPVSGLEDAGQLLDDTAALIEALLERNAGATAHVLGVGAAIAAPVGERGRVVEDVSLTAWTDVDLGHELRERLGVPVGVENDANAAALAEQRFGAGRNCADMVYLRLSPGVGAGLILNGQLYRGASGIAGELGHVTVDPAGALCECGGRGCLETVVSPLALVGELRAVKAPRPHEEWISLAASGDRHARRLIADAGVAIGSALATSINLLNPDRVVVGGDLAEAGAVLFDAIERSVAGHAIVPACARARIVGGELGPRASILGAATALISRELQVLVAATAVA